MSALKDQIINWEERTFHDRVDYSQDFLASLEKEFPKLHEKFTDLLVEYATHWIADQGM